MNCDDMLMCVGVLRDIIRIMFTTTLSTAPPLLYISYLEISAHTNGATKGPRTEYTET